MSEGKHRIDITISRGIVH